MSITKEKKARFVLPYQNFDEIKKIVEANQHLNLNEIADILNKWGYKSKRGYVWTNCLVSNFFVEELGIRRHKAFTKKSKQLVTQEIKETEIIPNYEIKDLVFEKEGKFFTDSLMVSSIFEKEHSKVLDSIKKILETGEIDDADFSVISYQDKIKRTQYKYLISKNGFALLGMGFTGDKALKFKIAYIKQFNKMEEALKELSAREVMALTLQSLDEQDIKLFNQIKQESDSIKFETHQALEIQKQELDKKIKELDKKVSDIQNIQPSNLPLFNIESKGFLKTKETFKGNIPFQKEKNVITDLVMEYKTLRNINDGTAWNALYDTYRQNTNPPIDLKEERDLYNQGKKGAQIIPSTILYAQQFGYCPQLLATINKMVFNLKEVLK